MGIHGAGGGRTRVLFAVVMLCLAGWVVGSDTRGASAAPGGTVDTLATAHAEFVQTWLLPYRTQRTRLLAASTPDSSEAAHTDDVEAGDNVHATIEHGRKLAKSRLAALTAAATTGAAARALAFSAYPHVPNVLRVARELVVGDAQHSVASAAAQQLLPPPIAEYVETQVDGEGRVHLLDCTPDQKAAEALASFTGSREDLCGHTMLVELTSVAPGVPNALVGVYIRAYFPERPASTTPADTTIPIHGVLLPFNVEEGPMDLSAPRWWRNAILVVDGAAFRCHSDQLGHAEVATPCWFGALHTPAATTVDVEDHMARLLREDAERRERQLAVTVGHDAGWFTDGFATGQRSRLVALYRFTDATFNDDLATLVQDAQESVNRVRDATLKWSRGALNYTDYVVPHLYNLGISKPGSVDSGDLANTAKAVMDSASSPYDSATIGRDSYDFYAMIFPCLPVSWGGLGSVKGSKAWFSCSMGASIAQHEFGHNLGLNHARANREEYGNPLDVMGGGSVPFGAYGEATMYGMQWRPPIRTAFMGLPTPWADFGAPGKPHCDDVEGATCLEGDVSHTITMQAIDDPLSLPVSDNTWRSGLSYQLPTADGTSFMWAAVRGKYTSKVAPGVTVTVISGSGRNSIGYTGLVDTHAFDTSLGNSNILPGSAYVFEGTVDRDEEFESLANFAFKYPPLLVEAVSASPGDGSTTPYTLQVRSSFLDADGNRLEGRGCDDNGCRATMASAVVQEIDSADILAAGAGGVVISGSVAATGPNPVAVYTVRMTSSEPLWLTASTCHADTTFHSYVAVFKGARPPYAHVLYHADAGDALATSAGSSCNLGNHGHASARIDVKPPVQSSTAWDGIVYITVEADPSLTASDPVADRAGDFKLVLTATSQSAGSVPCGDYISITMGSGSGWGSINGIYKLDADVPEVNGKPHYVHESKDYFHLVWKKFGSSPFKWCIRPSATTSSVYVCSPNDAITGENSVFDLTSLDFAGASTVRCSCPAGAFTAAADRSECSLCPALKTSTPGAADDSSCGCLPGYIDNSGTCEACPAGTYQSSNSCASCATYATSDVASAVASACHTRQDVLDLVSDISAGPCPVLKVTATSSTYLAGTYNIMPGFEVNGAPVYLREDSKYYLRFTGSRYLFEQTLNSGTYWGAVDYTGKYLGDAGTNGVFTFRCQCQDGAKRTAKCDCADGLNADASDICRPCAAPLYLPRPPATQACSACPAMTHRSGATTECDIVGCHAYYFDVTREGSNMNWYKNTYVYVDPATTDGTLAYRRASDGITWWCAGYGERWWMSSEDKVNGNSYYLRINSGAQWNLPNEGTGFHPESSDTFSFTCTQCRPGWYMASANECALCPGYPLRTSAVGATSVDACMCAAGHYLSDGSCVKCPANTYKAAVGDGDVSTCLACDATFTSASGAASCSCAYGYEESGGSCVPRVQCPAGTALHPSKPDACVGCPVDTYSSATNTAVGACVACPHGSWTNGATNASDVSQCTCRPGMVPPPGVAASSNDRRCVYPGVVGISGSSSTTLNGNYSLVAVTAAPSCRPTYAKQPGDTAPYLVLTPRAAGGARWVVTPAIDSVARRYAFSSVTTLDSPASPQLQWRVYSSTTGAMEPFAALDVVGWRLRPTTASCDAGISGEDAGTGVCHLIPLADNNNDGTPDCRGDLCPTDDNKSAPGLCGCGNTDTDTDSDGALDNCAANGNPQDGCVNDANKMAPGKCGCGTADTDTDSDGAFDNCAADGNPQDGCVNDANKMAPGKCGCGTADTDTDADGALDNCAADGQPRDLCPNDAQKTAPGKCGCGNPDTDTDSDGALDNCAADGQPRDDCDSDPLKTSPGLCGCGTRDVDSDGDKTPDCKDQCPGDPLKIAPTECACNATCVASCSDGILNADESDVDCGHTNNGCSLCDSGFLCTSSQNCGAGLVCARRSSDQAKVCIPRTSGMAGRYVFVRLTIHGSLVHFRFRGRLRQLFLKWLAWFGRVDPGSCNVRRVRTTNSIAVELAVAVPDDMDSSEVQAGMQGAMVTNSSNVGGMSNLAAAMQHDDPDVADESVGPATVARPCATAVADLCVCTLCVAVPCARVTSITADPASITAVTQAETELDIVDEDTEEKSNDKVFTLVIVLVVLVSIVAIIASVVVFWYLPKKHRETAVRQAVVDEHKARVDIAAAHHQQPAVVGLPPMSPGHHGMPMHPQPGYPMGGQPGYPMGGQPGYPMGGQPGYPMGGQPGYPMGRQPLGAQPGYTMPHHPQAVHQLPPVQAHGVSGSMSRRFVDLPPVRPQPMQ